MASTRRTRAGLRGLLLVVLALVLLTALVVDLSRDDSLIAGIVYGDDATPAEGAVRSVRGGFSRPPR